MVCTKCGKGKHGKCEYPKSCSCQHRVPPKPEPEQAGTGSE